MTAKKPNRPPGEPLTDRILELWDEGRGMSKRGIAKKLGCSIPNVHRTLKRYMNNTTEIAPLPTPHQQWLEGEARKAKVPVSVYLRAVVVDAIEEIMEQDRKRSK